jgi:hypothetical protein
MIVALGAISNISSKHLIAFEMLSSNARPVSSRFNKEGLGFMSSIQNAA